jgi:hypothetical protein
MRVQASNELAKGTLSLQGGYQVINQTDNNVAWTLLMAELDDAKEYLTDLTNQMATTGRIDEADFATRLGDVYAHLNRAWHRRNQTCKSTDEQRAQFTQSPQDLSPVDQKDS